MIKKNRFDIRVYKRNLRERYKRVRTEMPAEVRSDRDSRILHNLLLMPQYTRAKTVLTFVSTAIEVDTHSLIDRAFADGKRVAVPYCVAGTREMRFYCISSWEDLVPRTFGVLEPVPEHCELLENFRDSICILPGLAFDRRGYRLGYGGGYYDRFLSKIYRGHITIGVCYSDCVRRHLIHGHFDVPCDYLVTDQGMRNLKKYRTTGHRPRKKGKSP